MLAEASLNAKENGQAKLKREEVVEIVHQVKMQERIQTKWYVCSYYFLINILTLQIKLFLDNDSFWVWRVIG